MKSSKLEAWLYSLDGSYKFDFQWHSRPLLHPNVNKALWACLDCKVFPFKNNLSRRAYLPHVKAIIVSRNFK